MSTKYIIPCKVVFKGLLEKLEIRKLSELMYHMNPFLSQYTDCVAEIASIPIEIGTLDSELKFSLRNTNVKSIQKLYNLINQKNEKLRVKVTLEVMETI